MIPATIGLAIVSGFIIRANVSADTIFVSIVTVLSLMSIGGLVFRYYDRYPKKETKK
jgi:hypothetical protein